MTLLIVQVAIAPLLKRADHDFQKHKWLGYGSGTGGGNQDPPGPSEMAPIRFVSGILAWRFLAILTANKHSPSACSSAGQIVVRAWQIMTSYLPTRSSFWGCSKTGAEVEASHGALVMRKHRRHLLVVLRKKPLRNVDGLSLFETLGFFVSALLGLCANTRVRVVRSSLAQRSHFN